MSYTPDMTIQNNGVCAQQRLIGFVCPFLGDVSVLFDSFFIVAPIICFLFALCFFLFFFGGGGGGLFGPYSSVFSSFAITCRI